MQYKYNSVSCRDVPLSLSFLFFSGSEFLHSKGRESVCVPVGFLVFQYPIAEFYVGFLVFFFYSTDISAGLFFISVAHHPSLGGRHNSQVEEREIGQLVSQSTIMAQF